MKKHFAYSSKEKAKVYITLIQLFKNKSLSIIAFMEFNFRKMFLGLLTFASVAWYTAIVYNDFFRVETQDNFIQWELGACVYLGYIASFLCVLAFFACVCRPGPREKSEKRNEYYYKPKSYNVKTSKDDEQIQNLLHHYKSGYSRSRSSQENRSKSSSQNHSSKKPAHNYSSKSSKSSRRSGRKNRSVSFSSHSDKSISIQSAESCSTSDTYRYSAYV